MAHLTLLSQHALATQMTKTCVVFRPGATIYSHQTEWSDVHRLVRFNETYTIGFTEIEYQLFVLLVEYYLQQKKEVSYADMVERLFGTTLIDEVLPLLRKRVSSIRKKISRLEIDIVCVPQRGYELRDLSSLHFPYRRGHRSTIVLMREGMEC